MMNLKNTFTLLLFILIAFPGLAQVQDTLKVTPDSTQIATPLPDTITVIGVGDIMMGSSYPKPVLPPADGKYLMQDVESILQQADVTMGNLEGVLLDEGGTPKTCRNPNVCYVFRSPSHYINNLVAAGFDLLSLANNHAGDFGDVGRQSTMQILEQSGIQHAGQSQQPYSIIERRGLRFGFVAFAPNSNCIQLNDLVGAVALVQRLDTLTDIVIVSFHGGAEGPQHQHITRQREVFYGEDRGNVYEFAHTLIDAGADIIFGHGPHVTRAVDVYKNRFIAYSLGNFCTYGGINVSGINGLAPIMKVYTTKKGEFIKGEIIPTYQRYREGVFHDPEKRVISIIQNLTKKDFPEVPLRIDDNGLITYLAQ